MQLAERERKDFLTKANDLLEDIDVGAVLGCGDAEMVKKRLEFLEIRDLKEVMQFLVEEEAISFDE